MSTTSFNLPSELPWQARFVETFPGDPIAENYTRAVRDVCYSEVKPTPVPGPAIILWSQMLAQELGVARPADGDLASIELLAGNRVLPGMRPYAARYGGNQFGHWAGQLGDGRAITLGEVVTASMGRMEFQLKGAGPTPYSRRADGRAVLRSSIREFLCSEAMHFLGVPTTRALSLVWTGEPVMRDMFYDGNAADEPGAIVCRVAPSFLRFGNFEILAAQGEVALLKKLTDYLIKDHYPMLDAGDPDVYGRLLDEICQRTAVMIAHWMRVGFVHGVMNTDNMSALGLTIDYGPYGWLEPYEPDWTPNTTDAGMRRYRYEAQPAVARWNLLRLGEALLPLIKDKQRVERSINLFTESYEKAYGQVLAQKFGFVSLESGESEEKHKLIAELFELLQKAETDFTVFFRRLSNWQTEGSGAEPFEQFIAPAFYSQAGVSAELRERWAGWSKAYSQILRQEGVPDRERQLGMKKVNPKYVFRNYLAQNAIKAAEKGDLSVLQRLLRVLQTPYDELPLEEELAAIRPEWARHAPGCAALSCSS